MNSFSTREALRVGWEKTKTNLWFLVAVYVTSLVISYGPRLIGYIIPENHQGIPDWVFSVFSIVFFLVFMFLGFLKELGLIRISLNLAQNTKVTFSQLFDNTSLVVSYFIAHVAYTLIVVLGLILFIVPGIILSYRLFFYDYYIVDKKMNFQDALRASWQATKGHGMHLLVFSLVMALANLGGALLLGVGLLITMPATAIATAYVYKKLDPS